MYDHVTAIVHQVTVKNGLVSLLNRPIDVNINFMSMLVENCCN